MKTSVVSCIGSGASRRKLYIIATLLHISGHKTFILPNMFIGTDIRRLAIAIQMNLNTLYTKQSELVF